ncbi:TVP38/TMEM64 family protein [soil metagenome]
MTPPDGAPASGLLRAAALAGLVAVAAAGFLVFRDQVSVDALRENRAELLAWRDQHLLLGAAAYAALFVAVVTLSIPGAFMMTLAGGFLFGPVPGAALAVLSASGGALLIFLAARAGFAEALRRRLLASGAAGLFARVERGLARHEWSYLLLLRLVPAVPFTGANLAPAFLGVRAATFFLTTLLGILPGTALTAWIGAGLGDAIEGEAAGGAGGIPPAILVPLMALIVLAALPILAASMRRGGRQE